MFVYAARGECSGLSPWVSDNRECRHLVKIDTPILLKLVDVLEPFFHLVDW